jgi:hypothetical protein
VAHVRVRKILVLLTILALVLGSADLADAKKKRKKKKNSVPTTLVIESASVGGTHIAGTVESSREGCVDERKVEVTQNGNPIGAADSDSEGQWFIDGTSTIRNGDNIQAEVEKVVVKSKKKKITCGSDSDRFVAGSGTGTGTGTGTGGQRGNETLTVTVTGPGTVTSNPPGINCRQTSGTCQRDFPKDSNVTLTATPDTDATFQGWSGDCAGQAQCNVRMDVDRNVGATFAGEGAAACPIPETVPEPVRGVLCLVVGLLG